MLVHVGWHSRQMKAGELEIFVQTLYVWDPGTTPTPYPPHTHTHAHADSCNKLIWKMFFTKTFTSCWVNQKNCLGKTWVIPVFCIKLTEICQLPQIDFRCQCAVYHFIINMNLYKAPVHSFVKYRIINFQQT